MNSHAYRHPIEWGGGTIGSLSSITHLWLLHRVENGFEIKTSPQMRMVQDGFVTQSTIVSKTLGCSCNTRAGRSPSPASRSSG